MSNVNINVNVNGCKNRHLLIIFGEYGEQRGCITIIINNYKITIIYISLYILMSVSFRPGVAISSWLLKTLGKDKKYFIFDLKALRPVCESDIS